MNKKTHVLSSNLVNIVPNKPLFYSGIETHNRLFKEEKGGALYHNPTASHPNDCKLASSPLYRLDEAVSSKILSCYE